MDSNPRYRPGRTIKGDKKDIANYRPNALLNQTMNFVLLVLKNQMQKNFSYYNR